MIKNCKERRIKVKLKREKVEMPQIKKEIQNIVEFSIISRTKNSKSKAVIFEKSEIYHACCESSILVKCDD
jgi:hypothetical protein